MTKKFKPFKTLHEKGIKKGKVIFNIISCIVSIIFVIASLFIVFNKAIELHTYTKGAEKCRVSLTEEINSYSFYESDNIQIVSTGETVKLNPMYKINSLFKASDYFTVGNEYEAVWFYYQGEKTVHLKWMFLIFHFELIYSSILLSIAALFVSIITYRRVKYADVWKKKEVLTEKYSKIRKILISILIILFIIFVFVFDWHYHMIYNSVFYTIIIVLGIVQAATEDYYIHLIPPGPTEEDTEPSEID